jgi:hypothetical protein
MSKKIKLKLEPRTIYNSKFDLFYSNFCLTDDINFSEFWIKENPNPNYEFKPFTFTEKNLIYMIGDEPSIIIDNEKEIVQFDNLFIDKFYFLYFTMKYDDIRFYWLQSFLNEPIFGLIGILKGTKLIGLLKLKGE